MFRIFLTIFSFQWKISWKLVLILALSSSLIVFAVLMMFPNLDLKESESLFQVWPPVLKNFFGDPVKGFSEVPGWLNLQYFNIVHWLIFGIFASLRFADSIGGDRERNRLEVIMSLPVKRTNYLVSIVITIISQLIVASLILFLSVWLGLLFIGKNNIIFPVGLVIINSLPLIFLIGLISLLFSIILLRKIVAVIISSAIIALFFFIEEVVQYLKLVPSWIFKLLPFYYYRSGDILLRGIFDWLAVFVLGLFCIFVLCLCIIIFKNKEISSKTIW